MRGPLNAFGLFARVAAAGASRVATWSMASQAWRTPARPGGFSFRNHDTHRPLMTKLFGPSLRFCAVFVLLYGVGVAGLENGASAEPPPRLRAPRLSLSVAAPDAVLFAIAGGVLFADAADRDSRSERNISLGLASAYTALFGMNLAWIVEAGAELTARLDRVDDRMNARTARIGTAFSVIDSAARASVFGIGIALIAIPAEGIGAAGAVGAGITLVVTNGILLPFHIWAAVVHIKELRWRKRGIDPYRAHKLSPIPGGFKF